MALISVITIVKDHASGLLQTFSSLKAQEQSDWELLIVVGTSSDSTLQTAREIANADPHVKVIEQSGLGIYSAMNEGIKNAIGEFSWFMNAGDKFANIDVLATAIGEIRRTKAGLVIGGYGVESDKNRQVYSYSKKKITALNFAFNRHGGCHQAMIFRTDCLRQIGGYDLSYRLASDFDLALKVIDLAGATRDPHHYATIEPGGVADKDIFSVHQQKHLIRKAHFDNRLVTLMSVAWTVAVRTKIILRRLFSGLNNL